MTYSNLTALTLEEQRSIDGGIICAGLCLAGAAFAIGLIAGVSFGISTVNSNREMQNNEE